MPNATKHKPTIELLKQLEGFTAVAKYDVNRYRIGYGCELLEDGSYVQAGMTIDRARGEKILLYNMEVKQKAMQRLLTNPSKLNEYQNGALLCYSFNRGIGAFEKSELRKMVNRNPNDSSIVKQFTIEWGTNTNYKTQLIERRGKEANHYKKSDLAITGLKIDFLSILAILSILFIFYKYAFNHAA